MSVFHTVSVDKYPELHFAVKYFANTVLEDGWKGFSYAYTFSMKSPKENNTQIFSNVF